MTPLNDTRAAEQDDKAVREAMTRFHAALQDLFTGDVEPMKQVWSHADDVTYLGPNGGILVGWDQVLENWETQAAKKLGGGVTFEKLHFTVGRDLAVVECRAVGEHFLDGKRETVSIRVTSIFRNENGQWKMIGHHTDLLPFLE